jgi:hypothetical protein
MRGKTRARLGAIVSLIVAAGVMAAVAAADKPGGARFHIDAAFHSEVLSYPDTPPEFKPKPEYFDSCDVFLVKGGPGVASGTHVSSHSVTQAEECSIYDLSDFQNPRFLVHGRGIFVTPNGDVLRVEYCENAPAPDFQNTGNFHDEGPMWIVGGTGHFAGATGEGTVIANGNVYTGLVTAQYDGVIQLGNAKKAGPAPDIAGICEQIWNGT